MKRLFLVSILLTVAAFFSHLNAQTRTKENFDDDWKFILDSVNAYNSPDVNDASWRTLNLPHDWSIEMPFDSTSPTGTSGGALRGGLGWYRKTFSLPESSKDKNVFIDFDGVYMNSEVWINGHSLGVRPNGYISFRYDLTPYLKFGTDKNIIAVKVDNSKQPNSRWYSGSGIYRNVWLVTTNKVFVDHWGTYINTSQVNQQSATIDIKVNINNTNSTDQNVVVKTILYDEANKAVATASSRAGARARHPTPARSGPLPGGRTRR